MVDAEVGETLKKKIDVKIRELRRSNKVLNDKIESEGIHMLRIQITKWAAEAWEEICATDLIPKAFKKCGLCNDVYGRERHLIECQHMLTYEAPGPTFQWMDEPYSEEEIMRFYKKEVKAIQDRKKKRKIENQMKIYFSSYK